MSNKLKAKVDPLAGGALKWYIAGGGAAWSHIYEHMCSWHGAHDWQYFESVQEQIFPGDIEGNAIKGVRTTFQAKYGVIDVELQEMDSEQFQKVATQHCVVVDDVLVFSAQSVIHRYKFAGNSSKKAKRDLRSAMLQLVIAKQPITAKGVESRMPRGLSLMQELANVKRRK